MNVEKWWDSYEYFEKEIDTIRNDAYDLCNDLANDGDINDWGYMLRINGMLKEYELCLFLYSDLLVIIDEMESDKDKFIVQSRSKYYIDRLKKGVLPGLIRASRQWSFKDYRCRRLQVRIEQFVMEVLELI